MLNPGLKGKKCFSKSHNVLEKEGFNTEVNVHLSELFWKQDDDDLIFKDQSDALFPSFDIISLCCFQLHCRV